MVAVLREASVLARPLKEGEVETNEGGIAFAVDQWERLRRWLILGSEKPFYSPDTELTVENIGIVRQCAADDPVKTLETIVNISTSGRAPKNDPAILALAVLMTDPVEGTRILARDAVNDVCRTGTHILHFASFIEALGGGWGPAKRKAVGRWFTSRTAKDLAYQAVKYPSRDGWALADLLRLSHPLARPISDPEFSAVVEYILRGWEGGDEVTDDEDVIVSRLAKFQTFPDLIRTVATLPSMAKTGDIATAAEWVKKSRVPREAIPTEMLNSPVIWDALLSDMPLTAMVRNLGKMTSVGVLDAGSAGEATVLEALRNQDWMRKARLHPVSILSALVTYEQGHGVRGKLTWKPNKNIITALDEAFYLSFGTVPPTRQRLVLALDVSSSMDGARCVGMPHISARMAAAAMALVTANVEPNVEFVAYSHQLVELTIRPSMRLDEVMRTMAAIPYGGTYCTLPILTAMQHGVEVDAFISYTDSETRNGGYRYGSFMGETGNRTDMTADEALRAYRQKTGINAKHAVVAFAANEFSVANPNDMGQADFAGLDSALPGLLSDFVAGVL